MKFLRIATIITLSSIIAVMPIFSAITSAAKAVDIDGDGSVGISDATEIQKVLAGINEPSDNFYDIADVDEDGLVDIDDVTYIQKFLAGLSDEDPSTEPTSDPSTEPTTIVIYPSSLSLNKKDITLGKGEEFILIADCDVENCIFTFVSENSSVAEVTDEGIISAVSEGTANIVCSTANGLTATCLVTVKPMATSVSLNKSSLTLGVGEQFDLDSRIEDGTAAYHRYFYSDSPDIVSVKRAGGLVTAKSVGTTKIRVQMNNGIKAVCVITVKNAPDKIYLNKTELAMYVGETFDLDSSLPKNTAAYNIKYTSNNPDVASVKAAGGIVTANDYGKAVITATAFNGKKVSCSVFVMPKSKKINNVPLVNQNKLPTGCETCSATMLLKFYGYSISETKFADDYLVKRNLSVSNGNLYGPDPNSAFIGSPYYSNGFGVYAPAMAKFMNNYFADNKNKHKAGLLEGKSLEMLCAEYISNGQPVMVWATINMSGSYKTSSWIVNYADENAKYPKGSTYTWTANEHCLVLTGYDSEYYYFNDPWTNQRTKYSRSLVDTRYAELGRQAIAVVKN